MVHWQLFSIGSWFLKTRMAFGTVRTNCPKSYNKNVSTQWTLHFYMYTYMNTPKKKYQRREKTTTNWRKKKSLSNSLSSAPWDLPCGTSTECKLHLFTYILRLRRRRDTMNKTNRYTFKRAAWIKSTAQRQHIAVMMMMMMIVMSQPKHGTVTEMKIHSVKNSCRQLQASIQQARNRQCQSRDRRFRSSRQCTATIWGNEEWETTCNSTNAMNANIQSNRK